MEIFDSLPLWAQHLVTCATLFIFWTTLWLLTSKIIHKYQATTEDRDTKSFKRLHVQGHDVLTGNDVRTIKITLIKLIGFILKTTIFIIGLGSVLAVYPSTRSIMNDAFTNIKTSMALTFQAFIDYLPDLFFLIVLFIIIRFALHILRLFFKGLKRKRIQFSGFYPEWADPTYKLVRFFVILFALIVAFPYLPGHNSPAFQATSLFLGVLVSLGSAGAVANIIAGIMIIYMRAFEIGDYVKIADAEGNVMERSMFVTRIKTKKNVEIAIPYTNTGSNISPKLL